MRAMEYHIISGRAIETRRSYMSGRPKKQRGMRRAGTSSVKKIACNERDTVKALTRLLHCNFWKGFLFVTLKYSNDRLPKSYEEAQKVQERFLRKLRGEAKKTGMDKLRYIAVTANWSKHDCPARLHHHMVLPPEVSLDTLRRIWPEGEIYIETVSNPGNLSGLAVYLLRNVHGLEPGKKKYSPAKGMDKPVYTEPKAVDEVEGVQALPGTYVVAAENTKDEDGRVVGSYIMAMAQEPPKVRGSMVILPKKPKRKESWNDEYMAGIRRADD